MWITLLLRNVKCDIRYMDWMSEVGGKFATWACFSIMILNTWKELKWEISGFSMTFKINYMFGQRTMPQRSGRFFFYSGSLVHKMGILLKIRNPIKSISSSQLFPHRKETLVWIAWTWPILIDRNSWKKTCTCSRSGSFFLLCSGSYFGLYGHVHISNKTMILMLSFSFYFII